MNATASKHRHLGRGLSALFGEQEESAAADVANVAGERGKGVAAYAVDLLAPSPLQPRHHFDDTALDELAKSIAEKGVLQPLLIRPDPARPGRYEIIAGERRWRAAQRAQLHEVPAVLRSMDDAEVLEVALIENLQRQDLSPVDEARGYDRLLKEFGHTQERLGEIVGKSRSHVANTLRLLTLPEGVLELLDQGKLNAGQARPLIGRRDAEAIALVVAKRGLSARQTERLAKHFGHKRRSLVSDKDADTAALEKSLEQATGYNVNIKFDGTGGTVTVGYANLEQLDDIARRLSSAGKITKAKEGRDPHTVDLEELLQRDFQPFPLDHMDSSDPE
ncbi:MAG: ParB/RepB/Spo0J family partition protein [Rhodospirillaceae bacterium]|nr:MAG: ParB/RepB/Spo0J family partition protein [Rhodospirillaceae bacterium]